MIDFDDDLDEMLSDDDHAFKVIHENKEFNGIRNSEYFASEGSSVDFDSADLVLYVASKNTENMHRGDLIAVKNDSDAGGNQTTYEITHLQPDGVGLTALVLNDV